MTLLIVPSIYAMQEVNVDEELSKLEEGQKTSRGPLSDLMDSCGVAQEDELAKRVRSRVEQVDRHSYDNIIKGLRYLAQKDPNALVRLQAILAQKRSGDEQPVDQVASLTAAVDILNGINGALASGETIANNWNQTGAVDKIEQILTLTTQTLEKLENRAEQTGCWGFCKKRSKVQVAPAAAIAPTGDAARKAK